MRVDYMMNLFTPWFYSFDLQYLQAKSGMIKSNSSSYVERFVAQTVFFIRILSYLSEDKHLF